MLVQVGQVVPAGDWCFFDFRAQCGIERLVKSKRFVWSKEAKEKPWHALCRVIQRRC